MGFAWSLLIFLVIFSTGVTETFELFVANTIDCTPVSARA